MAMHRFRLVILWLFVSSGLGSSLAYADSILTLSLNPSSGLVSGNAGQTVGWGFTLTNSGDVFAVVTSADFCGAVISSPCSTALGTFTDFIAQSNFTAINAHGSVTAVFNPASHTGVGSYTINPGALSGSSFLGQVVVTYDTFSDASLSNQISSDIRLSAPASVSVTVATPEPMSVGLVPLGILALLVVINRRHAI